MIIQFCLVKNPPVMWETWVWSLGWEDSLEKGKATHSSILAWRIPWTVVHGIRKSWTQLSDSHLTSLGEGQPFPFWAIGQRVYLPSYQRTARCLRSSSSLISNTNQQPEDFPNQATLESNLCLDRPQRWLDFRVSSKVLMYKWENLGHLVNLRS